MSNNSSEDNNNYQKAGWWFITFSVGTMVLFILDYNTKWVLKINTLGDLGTLIAGVSGVLASIASLLFILYNLKLQRDTLVIQQKTLETQQKDLKEQIEENKKSNSHYENQTIIMQKQQNEASFFNLLQYNNNLKASTGFNEDYYNSLKNLLASMTQDYRRAKAELTFLTIGETQLNPVHYFRTYHSSLAKSESIFNNIANMVSFIEMNFKELDKDFFHSVLYNNLSINEKIILGMCIDYDVFPKKILTKFDYKLDFNKTALYFKFREPVLPVLLYIHKSVQINNHKLSGSSIHNLEINFSQLIPLAKEFIFVSYDLKISRFGNEPHKFDKKYNVNDTLQIDTTLLIPYEDAVQSLFPNCTKNEGGLLQFKMLFRYGETSFIVYHTYNYSIEWDFTKDFARAVTLNYTDSRPARILA